MPIYEGVSKSSETGPIDQNVFTLFRFGQHPLQNSPLVQRHIDPSAIATAGTHAGSPVLEAYQEHSAISAGSPPLCQSGDPLATASSLGTRVGSMGMFPILNNSLLNGRAQDPQDRRRRGRAAVRPRACASCFSTFEGYAPWIGPRRPDRELPSSTAMFFAIWGRTFGENDLNCGARAIGCSMMTKHPLTELS